MDFNLFYSFIVYYLVGFFFSFEFRLVYFRPIFHSHDIHYVNDISNKTKWNASTIVNKQWYKQRRNEEEEKIKINNKTKNIWLTKHI